MIYQPDLFYFFDTRGFPVEIAFYVTAKAVSRYCYDYSAKLMTPKRGVKEKTRQGILPHDDHEREKLIKDIYRWISENSDDDGLYSLFLYDRERNSNPEKCEKFDHHDDTCCCGLNLTDAEFTEVRNAWTRNNLQADLFYPNHLSVQKGFHYYSPNQWKARQKKLGEK